MSSISAASTIATKPHSAASHPHRVKSGSAAKAAPAAPSTVAAASGKVALTA